MNRTFAPVFQCGAPGCSAVPVNVGAAPVYLSLFGTGVRNRQALTDVKVLAMA